MIQTNKELQKIRAIQSNIQTLSKEIKMIGRQQLRNVKEIQRCFDSCVPIIKSKIQESKKHYKVKQMHHQTLQQKQSRIIGIKLKKFNEIRQKTDMQALIFCIKHKGANEIREQSLKHEQSRKQQKVKYFEQNSKKSEKVKSCQSTIKQKLKSFHQQKIQDLQRIKKSEVNQKQLRVLKSNKLLRKISSQKISTDQKLNQTQTCLRNLKFALNKLKFMKPEQFSSMMRQTLNESILSVDDTGLIRKNLTTVTEENDLYPAIFQAKGHFASQEQLITSKIIKRLLKPNKILTQA